MDIYESERIANEIIDRHHKSGSSNQYADIAERWIPRPQLGQEFKQYFRPGLYLAQGRINPEYNLPAPVALKEEEELYDFPCKARSALKESIAQFWGKQHESKKEGIAHRTGIVLHGPPGSGKSMLLKQIIRGLVEDNQVVFLVDSPWYMKESIQGFRSVEPDRGLTVVIEDIDEIIKNYGEQIFLEVMGGLESCENIMFLATTNNLEEMSAKLKRRGRFDKKLEIKLPDIKQRFLYLSEKINGRESLGMIKKLARLTEGFSFGDLRDFHRSVYVYKRPLKESLIGIKEELAAAKPNAECVEDY